ncbi:UMP kinase, partial [Candidatus Gottesmanbacteria bacterium]|nr:UMP kinase [Candidatus Gottesmanbacteria bacterium]
IVVGGGATTRHYQAAARSVHGQIENEDLDWIGIHATRLNAHLLRIIFRDISHSHVLKHYEIIRKTDDPVVIAAGWKPGWSTDYCAITVCQDYGIANIVNMTNIDKVYDHDPKKFPDAKPIDSISWKAYRKMAGNTWVPGMNLPFDPIASKLAAELGVTVKILNGKNLPNLAKALDGKEFVGTTIA